MNDKPMVVIQQVLTSQNFFMILLGAIIWFVGLITPFFLIIGPLIIVSGFGLTMIATVQAAMTKPVTSALPGLLLGGLIQLIGYYAGWIFFIGWILSPLLIVAGGVLIIFYGSSLALQRADIPIVKDLEDFIESRKKKDKPAKPAKPKKPKEEVVDVEEEDEESSDTEE
jgi:hypothetical protein